MLCFQVSAISNFFSLYIFDRLPVYPTNTADSEQAIDGAT